ncbi:hypothetical protein SBA3_2300002 [Candidatus Sulfopaludibacter sp. SbA3]|nr:hypothetical protein SBA3_2300002 [Candidatus Sulfopaludibacter sp. SbA3]
MVHLHFGGSQLGLIGLRVDGDTLLLNFQLLTQGLHLLRGDLGIDVRGQAIFQQRSVPLCLQLGVVVIGFDLRDLRPQIQQLFLQGDLQVGVIRLGAFHEILRSDQLRLQRRVAHDHHHGIRLHVVPRLDQNALYAAVSGRGNQQRIFRHQRSQPTDFQNHWAPLHLIRVQGGHLDAGSGRFQLPQSQRAPHQQPGEQHDSNRPADGFLAADVFALNIHLALPGPTRGTAPANPRLV